MEKNMEKEMEYLVTEIENDEELEAVYALCGLVVCGGQATV